MKNACQAHPRPLQDSRKSAEAFVRFRHVNEIPDGSSNLREPQNVGEHCWAQHPESMQSDGVFGSCSAFCNILLPTLEA